MTAQPTSELPTTERVAAAASAKSGSPSAAGRRFGGQHSRIGLLRPIRIGQVAVWELALVAVAATAHPWRTMSIVVAATAFVAIALTSVRLSGLCLYQWGVVRLRFRRRPPTTKGRDPLAIVVPGLTFRRQIDRAGNRAGIADLGDSLTSVVRLTPAANPNPAILLDVLADAFERTDLRLAGAQLVVWSVPSPPRAHYYGDRRDVEPIQVHWLAVRYRPADAPGATRARGGGDTGAARATAAAALTLAARVAEVGYPSVVLDEPELRQELMVALGSDNATLAGGAEISVKQTWQGWSIGTLRQISFLPRTAAGGRAVLGRFASQAAFTCTSYSLRRNARGELRGESLVRIGVHPTARIPSVSQVGKALGVELLPHNGRHGQSVVDNLPLAR
jgi:type VII secretion protein EccE